MNIRKATLNDIDNNLLSIYIEGFNYHLNARKDIFTELISESAKEKLIEQITANNNTLVIEEESKIVGYISYKIKDNKVKTLWVDQLVVEKSKQKRGYGKKLMFEIEKVAKEEKCKRIELCCWTFNERALSMYERLGFKEQRKILEKNI